MNNEHHDKIDKYWSNIYRQNNERSHWWNSPHIIRHINQTICGKPLDGWNAGPIELLKQILPKGYILNKALSIGCGLAQKEMTLLENNLVWSFTCFELSEECINRGRKLAEENGLSDRITFIHGDFFESSQRNEKFDMVFWDNSLHHMFDTPQAIKTSYNILNDGGIFFCNDFVGKSQFQWSDMELAIVNGIRILLPDDIFNTGSQRITRLVFKSSREQMNKIDPSEAADSSSILHAVQETFTEPLIIHTGGLVYHLCLNDILVNIPDESDLLNYLLKLDDETIQMGLTHYAFILAIK